MENLHKKIANKGFEEESRVTSRDYAGHGVSKGMRRVKTLRNRAAKHAEKRAALRNCQG